MISEIDYGKDNKSTTLTIVNPKYIEELEQENKQLKSILTELEEWLDEEYNYLDKYGFPAGVGYAMGQIRRTKDKIQELKEKYK